MSVRLALSIKSNFFGLMLYRISSIFWHTFDWHLLAGKYLTNLVNCYDFKELVLALMLKEISGIHHFSFWLIEIPCWLYLMKDFIHSPRFLHIHDVTMALLFLNFYNDLWSTTISRAKSWWSIRPYLSLVYIFIKLIGNYIKVNTWRTFM